MGGDRLRSIVVSAAMTALALVLPGLFHMLGLGSKFLPLLLPLLVNGFLAGFPWAVLTGAVAPLLSALATGMPPLYPPVALVLSAEGAVLGGVASALWRGGRGRLWVALIAAVVAGRATTFLLTWLLAGAFGLPPAVAAGGTVLQGLPGVALELAVTALAVPRLRKGILFSHE